MISHYKKPSDPPLTPGGRDYRGGQRGQSPPKGGDLTPPSDPPLASDPGSLGFEAELAVLEAEAAEWSEVEDDAEDDVAGILELVGPVLGKIRDVRDEAQAIVWPGMTYVHANLSQIREHRSVIDNLRRSVAVDMIELREAQARLAEAQRAIKAIELRVRLIRERQAKKLLTTPAPNNNPPHP